ncbi:MAG: hypothetical protein GY932_05630 [Arcobacter sp.]|nr:hypothetical protein [Arcobacter sp.]
MTLKIITLLIFTLSISSCTTSEEDLGRIKQTDSLRMARLDSIIIEQEKVIGDIKFGMDKKTTEKLWEKFCDENKQSEDFGTGIHNKFYTYYIGNFRFTRSSIYLNPITPRFLNDSLYHFTIKSKAIMYEEFDLMVPWTINIISDILSKKFGDPDFKTENIILNDGSFFHTIKYWIVGEKKIEVLLNTYSNNYSIDIAIYKPKILGNQTVKKKQTINRNSEIAKEVF